MKTCAFRQRTIQAVLLICSILLATQSSRAQNVGIGTGTPDPSAILDLSSDSLGLLIPSMTIVQRDAISVPATGLVVFVTDDAGFYYFDGSDWEKLGGRATTLADADGDTWIRVEEAIDDDVIRFDMAGIEHFRMDSGRLEVVNNGRSVFIGDQAGRSDDLSENQNVFIGDSTGFSNVSGDRHVAVGTNALMSLTAGSRNVAVGNAVLKDLSSGSFNTAVGNAALRDNRTGIRNVAIGNNAMAKDSTGSRNVVIGNWAGLDYSGDSSIFIGSSAGRFASGSQQLFIENSDAPAENALIYGKFDTDILAFNAKVGIGTTTPAHDLHVMGDGLLRNNSRSTLTLQNVDNNSDVGVAFRRSGENYQWNIFREGTTDDLVFAGGNDADITVLNEYFRIAENNGFVGLGTSVPSSKLHVSGGDIRADRGTSTNTVRTIAIAGARSTSAAPFASINLNNYDSDDNATEYVAASIKAFNSAGGNNGELQFFTSNNGSLLPRMMVGNNGLVGIGTLTPVARLHIAAGDVRIDRGNSFSSTRKLSIGGARSGSASPYASIDFENFDNNSGATQYTGAGIRSHNVTGNNSGDLRFLTATDTTGVQPRMVITPIGRVGVGVLNPGYVHHIYGNNPGGPLAYIHNEATTGGAGGLTIQVGDDAFPDSEFIVFRDGDGSYVGSIEGDGGGGLSYLTASDRRLKTKISDFTGGLHLAMQMRPTTYEMKSAPGVEHVGVIAQEMQEVFPQAVCGSQDSPIETPLRVDYSKLTPVLLSAVQELKTENDKLNAEVEAMRNELAEIRALLNR